MSDNDGTNVELAVRTEISSEVWDRVSAALGDTFSPITETLGAVGDKIKFYRLNSTIRVIGRARELAQEYGIEVTESPPTKFLVKFLENASLEDENSPLVDRWARLLLAAGKEYSDYHAIFADILSQIGPNEASQLNGIWRRIAPKISTQYDALISIHRGLQPTKELTFDGMESRSNEYLLLGVEMPDKFSDPRMSLEDSIVQSLVILERQNLIKIRYVEGTNRLGGSSQGLVVMMTPLGIEFCRACEEFGQGGDGDSEPGLGQ